MRADLADIQTPENEHSGTITGADGRTYARRSNRMARKAADELVAAGTPVVLDLYGHGRFEWYDGDDARAAWADERSYVTASEPTAKQLPKHVMWSVGLWKASDGERLLYLAGRC